MKQKEIKPTPEHLSDPYVLQLIQALAERDDEIERLTAELKEERAIVDRIWALFGTPSYEELKGRSIYDLISELQARVDALEGAIRWVLGESPEGMPEFPLIIAALAQEGEGE